MTPDVYLLGRLLSLSAFSVDIGRAKWYAGYRSIEEIPVGLCAEGRFASSCPDGRAGEGVREGVVTASRRVHWPWVGAGLRVFSRRAGPVFAVVGRQGGTLIHFWLTAGPRVRGGFLRG